MNRENPPGGILDIDLNERLHVDIGAFCNNNCIFCMEEDREGREARVGRITPEDIKHVLTSNRARKEVMFVSGEPTLNRHFVSYVRWAATLGYERVGVISNGRRFADPVFCAKALSAGLNYVIISIHGADEKTHDGLTRSPRSFAQAMEGIRNLSTLKRRFPLQLNTSTELNRRNSEPEALDALVQLLTPHVDQMVFNIMQPFGRGQTHFDRLMLKYTELADRLGHFFANHKGKELPVYLVDIPYCTTENRGIPDIARGYIERYVHYEVADAATDPGKATNKERIEGGAAVKHRQLRRGDALETDENSRLTERHRDDQEQSQKAKRPLCQQCAYFNYCDGVWSNYLDRFGFDEFEPVLGD